MSVPASQPDYYAILGLLRDASPEEIKRAYHAAARRLHPDLNKLTGETEIFLDVQRAYEVLSNPERRAKYDATLPKEDAPRIIDCRVQYSRPNLIHLNEPQLIYVLLEAVPPAVGQQIPTAPMNLCLVLDRSTSMQGEKMDLAKGSAIEIMQLLRPEDIFGLVVFSDRAEVVMPSTYVRDLHKLQSRVQAIQPGGATEIYRGLEAGLAELRRSLSPERGNQLVLLTDGHTYGDEQASLQLAEEAGRLNIKISGFGIGTDWNDIFLDKLASITGSNSTYIAKPRDIQRLLIEKFKAFARTFADDMLLESRKQDHVRLTFAFRLQPDGGPIQIEDVMHLGSIPQDVPLSVLLEFLVEPSASQAEAVTLLDGLLRPVVAARPTPIPPIRLNLERPATDVSGPEPPPATILQALSRLALYRLQERARREADQGEIESATRHLRHLATQLMSQGQGELAKTALLEAENLTKLQAFTGQGSKEIKYGTRALLLAAREAAS